MMLAHFLTVDQLFYHYRQSFSFWQKHSHHSGTEIKSGISYYSYHSVIYDSCLQFCKLIICLIHAQNILTNMTKEVSSSRYRSTYAIVMCSIIIIDPSDVFLDVCNVCNAVAVFYNSSCDLHLYVAQVSFESERLVHVSRHQTTWNWMTINGQFTLYRKTISHSPLVVSSCAQFYFHQLRFHRDYVLPLTK